MTQLEKQLSKAIENLQNEHSEQIETLNNRISNLTQRVNELIERYNNLVTILN